MRKTVKLVSLLMAIAGLLLLPVLCVFADDSVPAGITDTPEPTKPPPVTPPVVPEASTLVLLGGSATGLAAYVGLQIRARRRRP
jgi:hypothetical protein